MLLVTMEAVELSVCRGEGGSGQRISSSVWQKGNILLAVMKMASISDSVAEDIVNLMVSTMVRMRPFKRGVGSSSERNICASTQLQARDSLRYPALAGSARTMSLAC